MKMKFIIKLIIISLVLFVITTRSVSAAIPEVEAVECRLDLKIIDIAEDLNTPYYWPSYYVLTAEPLSALTIKKSLGNEHLYNCDNLHNLHTRRIYHAKKSDRELRRVCQGEIIQATVTGNDGLRFLPATYKQRLLSFLNKWLAELGLKKCFELEVGR